MFKLRRFGSAVALSLFIAGGMTTFGTTVHAAKVPDKICAAYQAVYDAAKADYPEIAEFVKARAERLGCTIVP